MIIPIGDWLDTDVSVVTITTNVNRGANMNGQELKKKTQSGGIVYGTMLSLARNPKWGDAVAEWGLDYVVIDSEHASRGRTEIADLIAGIKTADVAPIVRVPIPSAHYVTMAMDAGAHGVLAPYCETVDEVREVVGSVKWLPLKGEYVDRAVREGKFPSDASRDYLAKRNSNNVCLIGIESLPALNNLPNILEVDGIDGIFVGPNDMSTSLGIPDQTDHPEYEEALRKVIALCSAKNVPVLIHHQSVELTQKWLREGARFVLYSSDRRSLHNAFRAEFGAIKTVGAEITGDTSSDIGESQEEI